MRKSMIYPIRFWAVLLAGLLLFQFSTEAVADYCRHEKPIDTTLNLSSSDTLSVIAAAGDLRITGVEGGDEAVEQLHLGSRRIMMSFYLMKGVGSFFELLLQRLVLPLSLGQG